MSRYRVPLPPLDPQGDYVVFEVSRFIDNLFGAARRERAATRRVEELSRPPSER